MLVRLLVLMMLAAPQAGRGGRVTFVILVTDSAGAPVSDATVTLTGPAQRTSRTEAGRLVFENLPAGAYKFRFEKDGFEPLERPVTGRGAAPIDVKVALTRVVPPLRPVPPLAPAASPASGTDGKIVVLDMPAFIEKNYVGRSSGKTTPIGCGGGGSSTLIQINDPIPTHTHADADEFLYVIAGQGSANMGDRHEPLGPGVYMLIPRGVAHGFTTGPKKPLVMISTRAGERCAG